MVAPGAYRTRRNTKIRNATRLPALRTAWRRPQRLSRVALSDELRSRERSRRSSVARRAIQVPVRLTKEQRGCSAYALDRIIHWGRSCRSRRSWLQDREAHYLPHVFGSQVPHGLLDVVLFVVVFIRNLDDHGDVVSRHRVSFTRYCGRVSNLEGSEPTGRHG